MDCRRRYVDLRISKHKRAAEPHSAACAADFITINDLSDEEMQVIESMIRTIEGLSKILCRKNYCINLIPRKQRTLISIPFPPLENAISRAFSS